MKTQDYHCSITANVTAEVAIKAINNPKKWWMDDFTGHSEKLKDEFTIRTGETTVTFKITELVPGKKVVWLIADSYLPWLKNKHEWTGTKLVWDITTNGNSTTVDMTHVGLVPGIECYDNCEKGWNFYAKESLLKYITKGIGMPDTPKAGR